MLTFRWAEFASRLNCTIAWRLWDTWENDCHVTNILSIARTTFSKAWIIFMSYSVGPGNDFNRNVRVGCPDFRASVAERAAVGSEKAKQRRADIKKKVTFCWLRCWAQFSFDRVVRESNLTLKSQNVKVCGRNMSVFPYCAFFPYIHSSDLALHSGRFSPVAL